MKPQPSAPGRIRRVLRLAGWNALFLVAGLALIGVVGEAYFRLRAPFRGERHSSRLGSNGGGHIRTQGGGAPYERP